MAAPKLTADQQNKIIEMLAAREPYAVIARTFDCSGRTIDYYAKKYQKQIAQLQEAHDARHINRGIRMKEKRLEELEWIYQKHRDELENNGLHYTEKKISAKGHVIEYDVYNAGMINQIRGLLDDMAKERGERTNKVDVTSNGETIKAFIGVDIEKV